MLSINLNSVIINPAPAAPAEASLTEKLMRRMGAEMFRAGRPYTDCCTRWEREGYRVALFARADYQTEAYLAQQVNS